MVVSPALNWSQLHRLRRLPNYAPGAVWLVSGQVNLVVTLSLLTAGFLGRVPIASAFGMALLIELATAGSQFLRVVASVTRTSGLAGGK